MKLAKENTDLMISRYKRKIPNLTAKTDSSIQLSRSIEYDSILKDPKRPKGPTPPPYKDFNMTTGEMK